MNTKEPNKKITADPNDFFPTPSPVIKFPGWVGSVTSSPDSDPGIDEGALECQYTIRWKASGSRARLEYVDPAIEKWLGFPQEKWFRAGFWAQRVHPLDRKSFLAFHRGPALEPGLHLFEYRVFTAEEEVKWVREFSSVVREPKGGKAIDGFFMDATDEHRLRGDVVSISHFERTRIGQELHDDFSQNLAGIACLSRQLERRLTKGQPALAAIADEITAEINKALKRARSLSHHLAPHQLEDSELVPFLKKLVEETATRTGVHCEADLDASIKVMDSETRLHLYRLCQEAIRNAIQHGKANRIAVELKPENDSHCRLAIQNNGSEIDATSTSSDGLGIRLMQYRCREIGASFSLQNNQNGGVTVTCLFPNPERS